MNVIQNLVNGAAPDETFTKKKICSYKNFFNSVNFLVGNFHLFDFLPNVPQQTYLYHSSKTDERTNRL